MLAVKKPDERCRCDTGAEPSLGLANGMTDVTFEKIGEIHRMGAAILLVERNVSRALSLVARA